MSKDGRRAIRRLHQLLDWNNVCKHQHLQKFGVKLNIYIIIGNVHPLEVVNRGSETQLQVENNLEIT